MNKVFQLDDKPYLIVVGLIVSGMIAIFLGLNTLKAWYAVRKSRGIRKPDTTLVNWTDLQKYAARQVYIRLGLFLSVLILLAFFWLNAFVWFNSIQISDNSLQLGFVGRKTYVLERSQVAELKIQRERRGCHLEIVTYSGMHFRSVRMRELPAGLEGAVMSEHRN